MSTANYTTIRLHLEVCAQVLFYNSNWKLFHFIKCNSYHFIQLANRISYFELINEHSKNKSWVQSMREFVCAVGFNYFIFKFQV